MSTSNTTRSKGPLDEHVDSAAFENFLKKSIRSKNLLPVTSSTPDTNSQSIAEVLVSDEQKSSEVTSIQDEHHDHELADIIDPARASKRVRIPSKDILDLYSNEFLKLGMHSSGSYLRPMVTKESYEQLDVAIKYFGKRGLSITFARLIDCIIRKHVEDNQAVFKLMAKDR